MYKIIGSDGKEYGPIDATGVRAWISEGRVDSQTLIKLEGAGQWRQLRTCPEFVSAAPPTPAGSAIPAQARASDAVATIIPYRNPQALTAYYLGLFSLFPLLGFFLAIAALILGIRGLYFHARHPQAKGAVHAWVGIVCGGLFGLFNLLLIIAMIVGITANRRPGAFGLPN